VRMTERGTRGWRGVERRVGGKVWILDCMSRAFANGRLVTPSLPNERTRQVKWHNTVSGDAYTRTNNFLSAYVCVQRVIRPPPSHRSCRESSAVTGRTLDYRRYPTRKWLPVAMLTSSSGSLEAAAVLVAVVAMAAAAAATSSDLERRSGGVRPLPESR
jgi:hypothetical protein